MNIALPHNKLQVQYRILVPGETARVMIAGATAADTVPEQWQSWRAMTRIQWFPAWLEGEQLEQALLQELRCSHPSAEDVAVDHITVLRRQVVLQER